MPALGAMPGAYPWTWWIYSKKDMTSIFSDKTENQTINTWSQTPQCHKTVNPYPLVWENFLPIPTYAQNYLQVNRVGKVPLNYWSWLLIGQNLRGNMSDSKQIEWSWQDFVLWKLSTHSPCLESIEWDLAGSLQATSSELHSICLESIEWELAGAFYYYINYNECLYNLKRHKLSCKIY